MPSRKILLAAGVCAVGLTLVGLGVRASFTTSVTATQTITTGTVGLVITDAALQYPNGDGGWLSPVEVGGAPFNPGVTSVDLVVTSTDSSLDQLYTVTVENTGTLPVDVSCALTGASTDGSGLNSEISVSDGTSELQYGTLAGVETEASDICYGIYGPTEIDPGSTADVVFEFYGSFDNSAQGQSVNPTLTITATDTSFTPL